MAIDLGSGVNDLINALQRDNPELSISTRIKRAWNSTVDPRIKEHVTAVFIVPNTGASEVIIYVDNSIWATELSMQSEILRGNLNLALHQNNEPIPGVERKLEQVEKLIFKLSKEEYISKEKKLTTLQIIQKEEPYKEAQPISLNEDETAALNIAVSEIENDDLREKFYAAAKANLEWQKGMNKMGA